MKQDENSYQEKLLTQLQKIDLSIRAISNIGSTIDSIYRDWKHPITGMADQVKESVKEYEEKNRVERQLRIIERQNTILFWTMIVTLIGIFLNVIVGTVSALIQLGIIGRQ